MFTVVIPDAKESTLIPIIRQKVKPDNLVYTDTWRSYNARDVSEFKHDRINHSRLFADKQNHINGLNLTWASYLPPAPKIVSYENHCEQSAAPPLSGQ